MYTREGSLLCTGKSELFTFEAAPGTCIIKKVHYSPRIGNLCFIPDFLRQV